MRYIGIDPGVSGGLACIDEKKQVVSLVSMPDTQKAIWEWVMRIVYSHDASQCRVRIEQVTGYMPGREGKTHGGQPGSHMFRFGQSYGGLTMALIATNLTEGLGFKAVIPRTWQKWLGVAPRDKATEKQADLKRRLKEKAEELFPEIKVTLNTCDALLLAEYCRQQEELPL